MTSNSAIEVSHSDNSHIFGIPFKVAESTHGYMMIDREDLREWVKKTSFLNIEMHFNYSRR